ncbi:MAG: four helix bundle protein [Chloroflexi bacterium]|nr:four helix bundle protein [Chloroflexota bacterium]
MAGITRFEEIEGWKTARELTSLIYRTTEQGAFAKDFGLKDQIRRASVSVMSNIAEGFESRTNNPFINYLGHAKGSSGETRSQLYVALDLKYITQEQFDTAFDLADKASRQIRRFIDYLEKNSGNYSIRDNSAEYKADNEDYTFNVQRVTYNRFP